MDLHPSVTHFPICLSFVLSIGEIASAVFISTWLPLEDKSRRDFYRGYFFLVRICGAMLLVTATLSFFTGLSAQDVADKTFVVPDAALNLHYQFGRVTSFLGILLSIFMLLGVESMHRDTLVRYTYRVSLAGLVGLSGITGYLGGELVFAHGAGVHVTTQALKAPDQSGPALQPSRALPQ